VGWPNGDVARDSLMEQRRRVRMAMDALEIERLIKAGLPDAQVTIRDLAGDGDHYEAHVVSKLFSSLLKNSEQMRS
jgi:hypothetical protein